MFRNNYFLKLGGEFGNFGVDGKIEVECLVNYGWNSKIEHI